MTLETSTKAAAGSAWIGRQGDGPALSLHGLADVVGPATLTVLFAPTTGMGTLRSTVLHDAADTLPRGDGALLLAVGSKVDDIGVTRLIAQAAAKGYLAVAVKSLGRPTAELKACAEQLGIGLLLLGDSAPWRDVDGLITSVLASEGVGTAAWADPLGELFALADTIAIAVGGSVAIEDLQQNVMAYSTLPGQIIDQVRTAGILGRKVPPSAAIAEHYSKVLQAHDVVRFPLTDGELPRAAVAIRIGARPLGSIWAIEDGAEFTRERESALLAATGPAALQILRTQERGQDRRRLSELLEASLQSRDATGGASRSALSYVGRNFTLSGFACVSSPNSPITLTRIGAAVGRHYAAYLPTSIVAVRNSGVYVLVPGNQPGHAVGLAQTVVQTTRRQLGLQIVAGVSSQGTAPEQICDLGQEVDEILRCVRRSTSPALVSTAHDVRVQILLSRVAEELRDRPQIAHSGVTRMINHDRMKGTQFASTLSSWLDTFGDAAKAGDLLGVHENTIRYRIKRAITLFNLNIEDVDERLSIWMQLRALLPTHEDESGQD